MYLGRFSYGDTLPLSVPSDTSDGVPTAPTSAPTVRTFSAAGVEVEAAIAIPIGDKPSQTAWFQRAVLLVSGTYPAGRYMGVAKWTISGVDYKKPFAFDVIAGGNDKGTIEAMASLIRPEAEYVLMFAADGTLNMGRNPS